MGIELTGLDVLKRKVYEDSDEVVQGNGATAFKGKDALNISEEFGITKVEMLK